MGFETLIKYKKKPLRVFSFLFDEILILFKQILYFLRYKLKNRQVKIGKGVRFNQKTIFSGDGQIVVNDGSSFGYKLGGYYYKQCIEIQARYNESCVVIGEKVAFNNSSYIVAGNRIEIGDNCRIGARVTMMDFEAHGTKPEERDQLGKFGQIIIGSNVWVGNEVIILKNVTIGDGSIIAAGSVVMKGAYPQNAVIAGNPAKVMRIIS